jgi:hemolysin activation/secretion protein
VAGAEYRFHLPRLFTPRPEPSRIFGHDFRIAPPGPRGRPDWDLILKAFVDYAHTSSNNAQPGERSSDLLGAGVGVELQLKRYVTVRVDWGAAMHDAQEVNAGDNRFHIAATLVY